MFTFKCHDTATDQNGMPYTIQARNYLMLSANGERLYVQNGQVWQGENSAAVDEDELPGWFFDQMRLQSPAARKEVGYQLPEDKASDANQALERLARDLEVLPDDIKSKLAALVQGPTMPGKAPKVSDESSDMPLDETPLRIDPRGSRPKTWTCEACNQEVPTTHKGVHIGRLRRLGRCS